MEPTHLRVLIARTPAHEQDAAAAAVEQALAGAGLEAIVAPARASVPALATAAAQERAAAIALWAPALAAEALCAHLRAVLEERGLALPVVALGAGDPIRLVQAGASAAFGPAATPQEVAARVASLAHARATPARPAVVGLDHIAICVADLDAAAQAFGKVLGLEPVHREFVENQKTETVFFDLGNGASIELISPKGGNAGLEKFLEKRGPGLHHVALTVDGLDRGLPGLEALGITPIDKKARDGARGHRVAFLHPKSAGGVLVELVEHPAHDEP